jgi:hypothetical protein
MVFAIFKCRQVNSQQLRVWRLIQWDIYKCSDAYLKYFNLPCVLSSTQFGVSPAISLEH